MAARSIGSGTISFGLVSIPIKLFTATSAQNVSFNQLHKKCGSRLKQQLVCPVDNEVVPRTDIVKGYEFSKDRYVQFSEEELKKLEAERTDRLDIVEFVPSDTVDFIFIEKTYYLGPDKGGDRAYKLLSESMTRMNRVAVGRFGTRGKEQLVLLRPYKGGLVMHHVFYADEVRSFDDVERPGEVEFKPVEAELADKLIEQLSSEAFKPDQYHDEYRDRVLSAVEQKAAGQEISVAPEAPQAQIIDLFEALKRSLTVEEKKPESEAKPEVKKTGPKRESKKKHATG
jgi:DNA end-binding protein Ku